MFSEKYVLESQNNIYRPFVEFAIPNGVRSQLQPHCEHTKHTNKTLSASQRLPGHKAILFDYNHDRCQQTKTVRILMECKVSVR